MKYESFLASVSRRASASAQKAEAYTLATLRTLAERLTAGEALDLAAQLPKPMQAALRPPTESAQRFGAEEFVRRVADRSGLGQAQAKDGVRVVFATLREAVSSGEFDDVASQLPRDFDDLVDLVPASAVGSTRVNRPGPPGRPGEPWRPQATAPSSRSRRT